ncbi:molybdate ABC transporter substrate-binding protein [Oceanobacillus senegalensis]|uniref:molybdate ABC transporter substrate-binding protein n=1 Tax=Oceanobacillus senegalensis TaxID=1936063 RepID=UPI0011816A9F|nr:molybdate ABC transporter substrate-binding protein [Oceanobacillus senegalensis]
MKKFFFIFICSILVLLVGCTSTKATDEKMELRISAASSMTESLLELKDIFEIENPSIHITFNFGGSGSLRRQIEQGAPIDMFFSASKIDYDKLEQQGHVRKGTAILENSLVLITSKENNVKSLDEFLGNTSGTLAMGTVDAVPAGTYSKELLKSLEVWNFLEDRIVFTKDVSQVLTLVNQSAADIGIVYASDVLGENEISVLETYPSDLHSPIEYYVAVIKNENQKDKLAAMKKFYQFILSDTAGEVFERNGFQAMK